MEQLTNRRALLLVGAATVGGMGMGGVSTCSGTATVAALLPGVIDSIQSVVAEVCGFVPDVATLITVLAMFPGIGGVATIAQPLLTAVSSFLCSSFHAQGGAEAAIAKKPLTMEMKLATGTTSANIHGLVVNPTTGKFVKF